MVKKILQSLRQYKKATIATIIDAIGKHEKLLKTNEIYADIYFSQQNGEASDSASEVKSDD